MLTRSGESSHLDISHLFPTVDVQNHVRDFPRSWVYFLPIPAFLESTSSKGRGRWDRGDQLCQPVFRVVKSQYWCSFASEKALLDHSGLLLLITSMMAEETFSSQKNNISGYGTHYVQFVLDPWSELFKVPPPFSFVMPGRLPLVKHQRHVITESYLIHRDQE